MGLRKLTRRLFGNQKWYQEVARLLRSRAEVEALQKTVQRQNERLTKLESALDAQKSKTRELYIRNQEYAKRIRASNANRK